MGAIYRARDLYSGDIVALKLLHSEILNAAESQRFAREAQLLAELHHPAIVSYVAHGQTPEGLRYLAMEWLDGEDLGQRLARGPLSLGDCLRLGIRAGSALSFAHERGILHRDLKPTNLFLVGSDVGQVKLLDFGIARRLAGAQAMTRTGMVIGTPEYMAPEQARGSRTLTAAADLFSLGCILYECLSGQPPFVADHVAAVLVRILFEAPPSITERRPQLPARLVSLLDRLLAKEPSSRPASASSVVAELGLVEIVGESALQPTVLTTTPRGPQFAESERSLFSVVLAAAPLLR
jgi:serine/threonine protein kinase